MSFSLVIFLRRVCRLTFGFESERIVTFVSAVADGRWQGVPIFALFFVKPRVVVFAAP